MTGFQHRETETGLELQGAIRTALIWTSEIDPASIGVSVTDGIVTLSGQVRTFKELLAVRRAVFGVRGVHGVADELIVGPCEPVALTDTMMARRIVEVLSWAEGVDVEPIQVRVTGGIAELLGSVSAQAVSDIAQTLVGALRGVDRVENHLVFSDAAADVSSGVHRAPHPHAAHSATDRT